MNHQRNLREDEAVKAENLVIDDGSQRYVTDLLGITQPLISRTVERFNELGSYCTTPGQGCKKSTDARDERYLMQIA